MPSQHRHRPVSIRLPGHLREWLMGYAEQQGRPVRAVVIEALEEYRAQREQERNDGMRTLPTELATGYLDRAIRHNFLRPDKMAWYPIDFPGIEYDDEGNLSPAMQARGTQHLIEVLNSQGCLIRFSDGTDLSSAVHHVLWDQWTKDEIGNGRFTGRLFNDQGLIYQGCTADRAARYTLERITALGGVLRSYTVQEDGPQ